MPTVAALRARLGITRMSSGLQVGVAGQVFGIADWMPRAQLDIVVSEGTYSISCEGGWVNILKLGFHPFFLESTF